MKDVPTQPSASWLGPRAGADGLALAAGQGQVVDLPVVLELVAARDDADDLDHLADALDGLAEGDAVPAFDDLRSAGAESHDEAPVGERHQRHGGHGRVGGGAGDGLHDARAQLDAGGLRSEVGEGGDGVVAPRFGGPDEVHAQALGLDGVGRGLVPVVLAGDAEADRGLHGAPPVR